MVPNEIGVEINKLAESLEKLARDDMGSFKTDSTGEASHIIIKVNG